MDDREIKKSDKKNKRKTIAFAAGGSGGHMFPAIALSEILSKRYEILFFTDSRGEKYLDPKIEIKNIQKKENEAQNKEIDVDKGKNGNIKKINTSIQKKIVIPLNSANRSGIRDKIKLATNLAVSFFIVLKNFIKEKPAALVTFGSYVTIPVAFAARLFKIPIIIHEQNAVLGLANKIISPFANVITTSFAETRGIAIEHIQKVQHCGMPVRRSFYHNLVGDQNRLDCIQNGLFAHEDYLKTNDENKGRSTNIFDKLLDKNSNFSLKKGNEFNLLIMGGSQGAENMSGPIAEVLVSLPENLLSRLRVIHQVFQQSEVLVNEIYSLSKMKKEQWYVCSFIKNVAAAMRCSDLIISRAGASTIAELELLGKAAILVPMPKSAHDHQKINAEYYVKKGGAILVEESRVKVDLPEVLESLFNKDGINELRKFANCVAGENNSAEKLAIIVNKIIMNSDKKKRKYQ